MKMDIQKNAAPRQSKFLTLVNDTRVIRDEPNRKKEQPTTK